MKRNFYKAVFLLFTSCVVVFVQAQKIYLVDAARPNGVGATAVTTVNAAAWANATNSISSAIDVAARNGDGQVWIKAGTYHPVSVPYNCTNCGTDPRNNSFDLRNNVRVIGGFAGTETALSQHDPVANPTILSGDIGVVGNAQDNNYHVVTSIQNNSTATLEGVTIRDGYYGGDNGSIDIYNYGAISIGRPSGLAIYLFGSSASIINCSITNNLGGTAVQINATNLNTAQLTPIGITRSAPVFTNCNFNYNSGIYGSAVATGQTGDPSYSNYPTYTNCNFTNNTASVAGTVYDYYATSTYTNCNFTNNTAGIYGGAAVTRYSTTSFSQCVFSGNSARAAGALFIQEEGSKCYIDKCKFLNNRGSLTGYGNSGTGDGNSSGGAIFVEYYCGLQISNSVLDGNSAYAGGAIHSEGTLQAWNLLLTRNSATYFGAAIYDANSLYDNAGYITNCTFGENNGGYDCGYASLASHSKLITNSIIWNNATSRNGIYVYSGTAPTVTYSLIKGGYTGTGNKSLRPYFVDGADPDGVDGQFLTADDGLRLLSLSPALNSGNGSATGITSTDILGNARVLGGTVDIGAYEGSSCPGSTIYVDSSKLYGNGGGSWGSAFANLQDAMAFANTCTTVKEIWVAKGTYYPAVGTSRDSVFSITRSGYKIIGGYPTGGGTRNFTANPTILSGAIGTSASNDNSYHVLSIAGLTTAATADSVVMDGFTIRDGYANAIGAKGDGGGIYIYNNTIGNKIALRNLSIINNFSNYEGGGGIYSYNNTGTINIGNCFILNNTATVGAGLYSYSSSANISNCVFSGNNGSTGCAIENIGSSNTSIYNCSIVNNEAYVGSIIYNNVSTCTVTNSIIWNNNGLPLVNGINVTLSATYNIIQGATAYAGQGNSNSDPLFTNFTDLNGSDNLLGTADDGLMIPCTSPAINTGTTTNAPAFDILGTSRPKGLGVDIGAYEQGTILTPSVSISAYKYSICNGEQFSIVATPVNGGAAPTYQWYRNGGQVTADAAGNSYTSFTLLNNDLIWVVMSVHDGCAGAATATSSKAQVTVTSKVTPAVSIVASPSNNNCAGTLITFTATPVNGGATPQYQWSKNGTVISGASGSTYSSATLANGDGISVLMSSSATCTAPAIAFSNTITMVVTGNVTPSISITASTTTVCGGTPITFSAHPLNGGAAPLYKWYKNGSVIAGATNVTYTTSSFVNNDLFWVVMSNNATGACLTTTTATSNQITITVGANFTSSVSIAASPGIAICAGTPITFTATPINGGASPSYQWIKNGSNSGSATTSNTYLLNEPNNNDVIAVVMATSLACASPSTTASSLTVTSYNLANGIAYVDAAAASSGNGASWASPFKSLQQALDAANACSSVTQIWVKKGTYYPSAYPANCTNCGINAQAYTFQLKNNLAIYGGFAGTETDTSQRVMGDTTFLSGDIGTLGNGSDNCYHVLMSINLDATSRLDGFTITGGKASGGSSVVSGVTIQNSYGGGMYNYASSPKINKCYFTANSSGINGGAIDNEQASSPTITASTFTANNSSYGGAVFSQTSSSPTYISCLFAGNAASSGGGAVFHKSSSQPKFINCTFTANSAGGDGGGAMYNQASSLANISNSIIWGNTTTSTTPGIFNDNTSSANVTYSNVQVTTTGVGNINNDPMFINTAANNYRLLPCSPSINTGRNDNLPTGSATDVAGNPRIYYTTVDMGAYEQQQIAAVASAGGIIYVKAGAGGEGSSWACAAGDLQAAINSAISGQQIWVAGGTYKPTHRADAPTIVAPNNRDDAFLMKSGVKLYGSFAGTETALIQRTTAVMAANISTLSGDFNGDDAANFVNNGENAYHVMVMVGAAATTVVDGFTISGGNAKDFNTVTIAGQGIQRSQGSGICAFSSSPTLTNIVFTGNQAFYGGGLLNYGSSPVVSNSSFIGNSANGGGMYNTVSASPTITNCIFKGNTSSYGGAIYNVYSSVPVLTNVIISGNTSVSGGGMYNSQGSSAVLTNVLISGNTASGNASSLGGGIYNEASSPVLTNVTISGNNATSSGGAMYNATIVAHSLPIVKNSIIYGNNTGVGNYSASDGATYYNSLVQDRNSMDSGNIASADPQFMAAPNFTTAPFIGGNYNLQTCSSAINTGSNNNIPAGVTTDLVGNARIYNSGTVDIGAYEYQAPGGIPTAPVATAQNFCGSTTLASLAASGTTIKWYNIATGGTSLIATAAVANGTYYASQTVNGCESRRIAVPITVMNSPTLYVDSSVVASGDGSSWATAYKTLTEATNAARFCTVVSTIMVAKGTYYPAGTAAGNANYQDSAFAIFRGGLKIYGGFPAGGGTKNIAVNKVYLDGAAKSYHVVVVAGIGSGADSLVLDGLIITGGKANGTGSFVYNNVNANKTDGAGIYMSTNAIGAKIALNNCTFLGDSASSSGGGLYSQQSSPTVSNCYFINNNASGNGGGVFNNGNTAGSFSNCFFTGNNSNVGGGINNSSSNTILANCVFTANTSPNGGGIYNLNSILTITNCTIAYNIGTVCGGLYNQSSTSTLINSIVWGNTGTNGPNIFGVQAVASNNLVQGGYTGTNNLNTDPLFVNAASPAGADGILGTKDDGLYLQPCSPAVNTGTTVAFVTDITSATRKQGAAVDMGAYEFTGGNNGNPTGTDLLAINGDLSSATIQPSAANILMANTSNCRVVAAILPSGANPITGSITTSVWVDAQPIYTTTSQLYLQRHYDISPATSTTTATAQITLYYTQADFTTFNSIAINSSLALPTSANDAAGKSNLRIYQYHGSSVGNTGTPASYTSSPTIINPDDNLVVWNAGLQRWEVTFNIVGFSGFFVGSATSIALPVKELTLSATKENGYNLIGWITVQEQNLSGFELQVSANAVNFTSIATMAAQNNYGTDSKNYKYQDYQGYGTTVYYRVQANDKDGTVQFSNIVSIAGGAKSKASIIYPNPARMAATLQLGSSSLLGTMAAIYDSKGKRVLNVQLTGLSQQINFANLSGGIYFISLQNGERLVIVKE